MTGNPSKMEGADDNEDVSLRGVLRDLNNLLEIRDLILSSLHHLKSGQDSPAQQDENHPAP